MGMARLRIDPIDWVIKAIITLLVCACILPFLHVFSTSISSNASVVARNVGFLPIGANLNAYRTILRDRSMIQSLVVTIYYTAAFTTIGMILTILAAYPLTKRKLLGRTFFLTIFVVTLYFTAGLIPEYILVHNLGMINTPWSIILPLALSPYNLLLMKTSFQTIPESLEESAFVDGCSHFQILTRIVLPLSKPILATLVLFYAVGRWNAYQDALFYLTKSYLYPLQLKLYNLVNSYGEAETIAQEAGQVRVEQDVLKPASIVFATVPILLVYPFVQKYFVKGVMIGAVKG
jgi:putative aldouronate transport system permease protein